VLLEAVDDPEGRMRRQMGIELHLLSGLQVVTVSAHERHEAAVLAAGGIQIPPAGQKVVVDEADDMKAVCHNAGFGEVFPHQGAVGGRQIHADHAHLVFALEALQIALQRILGAAQHHIINAMPSQVTQSSGKASLAGEEVFVDAQHGRTVARMPFGELALEAVAEVALHCGRTDTFAAAQAAAVDAIQMPSKNRHAEGLAGPLTRQHARQPLAELATAVQALPFAGLHYQLTVAQSPILMTHAALVASLAPLPRAAAMGAASPPGMPGRYAHLPTPLLNLSNLVTG
jgi:hypothetical protein